MDAEQAFGILYMDPQHKDRKALQLKFSKHVVCSFIYSKYIINERFELGEATISKDEKFALVYAEDVIKGKWTQELAVMCPCWLYLYAKDVIKGRLPTRLHNQMLAFGMIDSENKYVKKYCGSKKYSKKTAV